MTDCLSLIYPKKSKEKKNVRVVQNASLQPGLHDKKVPLCIKHVLSAQCAGQCVSQLLTYTPDLKHP